MFYIKAGNYWDNICRSLHPDKYLQGLKAQSQEFSKGDHPLIWVNLKAVVNFCPLASLVHLGSLGQPLSSMQNIRTQRLQSAATTEGKDTQTPVLRFGLS